MEMYNSETEQVDAIRKFFKENGTSMVIGLVLGVGWIFGWRYWQNHQISTTLEAVSGYNIVSQVLESGDESAQAAAADFIAKNKNSYGVTAALELAKQLVAKGDLKGAATQLQAATSQTSDVDLLALLNLRSARLYIALNEMPQALACIDKVKEANWVAEAEFLRGNVLLSQDKQDEAKAAYSKALTLSPSDFIATQLNLKLKALS